MRKTGLILSCRSTRAGDGIYEMRTPEKYWLEIRQRPGRRDVPERDLRGLMLVPERYMLMNSQQRAGLGMAIVGFVMLLINALSYLLNWDLKSPAFTVLGLVFVVIGAGTARKSP